MPSRKHQRATLPEFRWGNGNLSFRLLTGDIFTSGAEVLVNSEQSDFILAPDGKSISAKISKLGGAEVQKELWSKTAGSTLSPGVVLETNRGRLGRIYHAAIHEPEQERAHAASEQDPLGYVEACTREILRLACRQEGCRSVAFPLLGAGLFGLPPELSGATLARTVARFACASDLSRPLEVLLVVLPDRTGQQGLAAAVQVLLDEGGAPLPWTPLQLGVPLLDPLEQEIARARDPRWRAMLLCRYAEVFTFYVWANLAAGGPNQCRERLPSFTKPVSFGTVKDWLQPLAKTSLANAPTPLHSELANHCMERAQVLCSLVEARNHLAHGRAAPPMVKIEKLLREYIDPQRWRNRLSLLPTSGLAPWVLSLPKGGQPGSFMAILERCLGSPTYRFIYLDPCTGITHEVRNDPEDLHMIESP